MTALVDHAVYNSLPSLGEADISRQLCTRPPSDKCTDHSRVLKAPWIEDVINGPIRDVFIRHAANLTLCLYLQHRHYFLGADEAIVKVEGTAHLMDNQDRKDIISFGNKIVPTTWMSSSGKLIPMEYSVVPEVTDVPAPTDAFIDDFLAVLVANGCIGLFGIDTMAKKAWAETSIGDASVVVPSNESSETYDKERFIPVAFAFDEDPKFKVHGKCRKDQHKHTHKPEGK